VKAAGVPIEDLLTLSRTVLDASGLVSVDAALEGTVGAPTVRATAAVTSAHWLELDGLGLEVLAEHAGGRARLAARIARGGAAVANAHAEAPLELAALLVRPAETLSGLRAAPLVADAAVTGLDLATLSGRLGVPEGIAGRVDAAGTVTGSLAHPRAEATVDLSGGAWAGYRDVGAHAALSLAKDATSASGHVTLAGIDALLFGATLSAPPEKLASLAALRAAPLRAEVDVPRVALERTEPRDVPLAGTVEAKLTATGSPGAPEVSVLVEGDGLALEGRPLGKARLEATYARARTAAALVIAPPTGGKLQAKAAVRADLGLGARRPPLGEAPAELSVAAEAVDLSVLAALVPGRIRSAGGTLTADVSARGPLARPSPRGTVSVRDGRVAIVEFGEVSAIALEAAATEDAVELSRLEAHRGKGKVTASASLRGLTSKKARLEAHAEMSAFTISRAGMTMATLDVRADATGSLENRTLSTEITIPRGTIRLPNRSPRPLQPIDERKDISIGRPQPGKVQQPESGGGSEPGLGIVVHVTVPRQLFVKGDDPRVDVELRADVTYERTGGEEYARGYVETVRGTVEPIGGRSFSIQRARVQFTGGPPSAATLDVEARYENPAAVITAKVLGPLQKPEITLTSVPPMDEAQIALLIATGQRDLKAGTGSVGTLTGAEAGKAALGAVATTAFRELVANKLPIDTFSLDSGALRAGKYVTDKVYVGYVRRFEADPTRGENPDEVRIEYRITPRWNFESRYGTAQSGGASLIWSKDF
jgi:translocation and assembly module TamB